MERRDCCEEHDILRGRLDAVQPNLFDNGFTAVCNIHLRRLSISLKLLMLNPGDRQHRETSGETDQDDSTM
jgi:hypothetical protein